MVGLFLPVFRQTNVSSIEYLAVFAQSQTQNQGQANQMMANIMHAPLSAEAIGILDLNANDPAINAPANGAILLSKLSRLT